MMHVLASSERADAQVAYYAAVDLFEAANQKSYYDITGATDGCEFEVPILPNIYGQTPLDICLGLPIKEDKNGIFQVKKLSDKEKAKKEKQEARMKRRKKKEEERMRRRKGSKKRYKDSKKEI